MDAKVEQLVRMGFELAYFQPDAQPGIPLDEPGMSYYMQGMEAGRAARSQADSEYAGPSIGLPTPGSETWDAYQARLGELLEPLFHKHEPHIETEPPEI